MTAYLLGVDGGNSKTLALVTDESGRVLGVGRSGCANHQATSIGASMLEVRSAITAALAAAEIDASTVNAAHLSLAGADFPEDFDLLRPAVATFNPGIRWAVDNDAQAALRSGTEKADAAVVILGSETNAAGRNARGESTRFPALGWISGDWGGAGDIVREGIRVAVRSHDGRGQRTVLTELLPEALGVATIDAMIHELYARRVTTLRQYALAPVVFRAAESGDEVARTIIKRQGREAAVMAVTILARLRLLDSEPDVVLAGGLVHTRSRVLLDAIADGIGASAPDARIVLPDLEPAAGAVLLAFDLAGIPVSSEIRAELLASSPLRGSDVLRTPNP